MVLNERMALRDRFNQRDGRNDNVFKVVLEGQ